jgi:hypothetical protein
VAAAETVSITVPRWTAAVRVVVGAAEFELGQRNV